MIIIEKRKAARGAFWGLIVYCAMALAARFLAETWGREGSVLDQKSALVAWLGDARVQFAGIIAATLAGTFLPTRAGFPNEDSLWRAVLLAPLLGLLFLALHHEYGFALDFWSGLQFGFLAGAIIPPREDKRPKS